MIKRLEAIIKLLKDFNYDFYWLLAIKKIYNLTDSEAGFIIYKLKLEGLIK